jgi:hypothetical protein
MHIHLIINRNFYSWKQINLLNGLQKWAFNGKRSNKMDELLLCRYELLVKTLNGNKARKKRYCFPNFTSFKENKLALQMWVIFFCSNYENTNLTQ